MLLKLLICQTILNHICNNVFNSNHHLLDLMFSSDPSVKLCKSIYPLLLIHSQHFLLNRTIMNTVLNTHPNTIPNHSYNFAKADYPLIKNP